MAKGNFEYNYPRIIKFLKDNDIEYIEYNEGQHIRILGEVAVIDLWPSRLKYCVFASEESSDLVGTYHQLYKFDEAKMLKVLNGDIEGRKIR